LVKKKNDYKLFNLIALSILEIVAFQIPMMASNKAAWIKKPGGLIEVETVEKWIPDRGELLVQVEAVNFNPIDAYLQRYVYEKWRFKTSY
jgi:hypothetical protein